MALSWQSAVRNPQPAIEPDWFYRLGRALLNQTVRLYYRRIEVVGGERIPEAGPAMIVANHPNSVPDAYLLASQLTRRRINFVARDTITRAPVVGWLVRCFGLVGVARTMDYERRREAAFERNRTAIDTCVPRLLAGELIAIFGEGISTDSRRLHLIRKGAMRFGCAAEWAANFRLGLLWIPVGITYSAKQRFRSDVLIRVGQPFCLLDVHPDPAAHEREVLQLGTQRLQRDLESLIVNLEREELAGLIDRLADLATPAADRLLTRVERHQRVARAVQYFNVAEPQCLLALEKALHRYQRKLAATGLSDEVIRQRHAALTLRHGLLGMAKSGALMLLNLYGWANSLAPRLAARLIGPFGRQRPSQPPAADEQARVEVAREALFGTFGGWLGAALAFPLQTYLVLRWVARGYGWDAGIAAAVLYGLSLMPSWRLFVRRRDILRRHLANTRDALRFLLRGAPARRLQRERRRLQQELRALLAAYDSKAPSTRL